MIKCKSCKIEFEPFIRNGIVLSKLCTSCLLEKVKKQKAKEWQTEKKIRKEKLKTHSEWLKDLQKVFNTYIRDRDYMKPCISCERQLIGKFDAGHFFTVGAYPNIRFNEDNVHGQCVYCNQHLHGNISEYAIKLPFRIGQERFNKLLEDRTKSNKLTIDEIKTKIIHYNKRIKEMNDKRN